MNKVSVLLATALLGVSFSGFADGVNCFRGAHAVSIIGENVEFLGGCKYMQLSETHGNSGGDLIGGESSGNPEEGDLIGGESSGNPEEPSETGDIALWEEAMNAMIINNGARFSVLDFDNPHSSDPIKVGSHNIPENYSDWVIHSGFNLTGGSSRPIQIRDEYLPDVKFYTNVIPSVWQTSARYKGMAWHGRGILMSNNLLTHTDWFTTVVEVGVLNMTSDTLTNLDGFINLEKAQDSVSVGGANLTDISGLSNLYRTSYFYLTESLNLKDISPLSNLELYKDPVVSSEARESLFINQSGSTFTTKLNKDAMLCTQIKNNEIYVNFTYNSQQPERVYDNMAAYNEYCE